MHLVEMINYEVVPTQECFLIKPLRQLYNADRSKNKEKFMQQLSVLYFMADPRSSYNYITDPDERFKLVKEQEGLNADFKIDAKLQEAIDCYIKHTTTTSSLLLEDARMAVDKVRKFLREVDLTKTDEKGKPVYTVNSITAALKQLPQLAKDLKETEKILTLEIEEAGRARGGNDSKSLMDDGILI